MKGADVDEEWAYVGEWAVEEPHVFKGMEGDKGLVVKNAAAHHAISAKFPKPIDNKGKTLVVQYEVKLQSTSFFTFGSDLVDIVPRLTVRNRWS